MSYLNKFNRNTLIALGAIIRSCSDNHLKSDELRKILKPQGFKPEGLGTNIMVFTHKDDKKKSVVYKIALDEYGIQNNFDDIQLSEDIPEFVRVYEVEPKGLVSVQEYAKACRSLEEIQMYYKKIFKILGRLSKDYLIVDLSPDNIKNYGVTKKGELKIIDGSDLVPLDDTVPLLCQGIVFDKNRKRVRCERKLSYDGEYKMLVCSKCGKTHNPLEFKKKLKEVNIMKSKFFDDGLSERERLALDQYVEKLRNKDVPANDIKLSTSQDDYNVAADFDGGNWKFDKARQTLIEDDDDSDEEDIEIDITYNESVNVEEYQETKTDLFEEFKRSGIGNSKADDSNEESAEFEKSRQALKERLSLSKGFNDESEKYDDVTKSDENDDDEETFDGELYEESEEDENEPDFDIDSDKLYEEEFSSNREKKRSGQVKMKFPKE